MKIYTGRSYVPFIVLLGIWSVSSLTALPGLAVSPIMGELQHVFPRAGEMEIQLLSSLPSLLIIPFIILSGYLTQKVNIYRLLMAGLLIFGLTGVLYMLSEKMWQLIAVSILLGAGAGIIIPLSTGLVSLFFTGKPRTHQFGLNSSISNLTVVAATFLTGYLAKVHWRLSFAVYLLPFAAVFLILPLKKYWPDKSARSLIPGAEKEKKPRAYRTTRTEGEKNRKNVRGLRAASSGIDSGKLMQIMALYGLITFSAVVLIFYTPFLMSGYGRPETLSGTMISVFFLSIMLPGFFLNRIIGIIKENTILLSLLLAAAGLTMFCIFKSIPLLFLATILIGLGYGIIQPVCYDKVTGISVAAKNTVALSYVMVMNYLAILVCPEIIGWIKKGIHSDSDLFPFGIGAVIAGMLAVSSLIWRKAYIFRTGHPAD